MSSLYNIHYDEISDEENLIIKFADYETFKSYVISKYDKLYKKTNYEKININYYSVKWINFINRKTPILLQNKSGPCPLLCITNILLLRNQLHIDSDITKISQKVIENKILHILLDLNEKNVSGKISSCTYRKSIIECVEVLSQLKYGLDINCKFTNIHSFEYTKGLCIFDMFDIPIYHGWVISSDDLIYYSYLKDYSYNVIIDKIVRYNEYYEKNKKNSNKLLNNNSNNEEGNIKINSLKYNMNNQKETLNDIPIFPDDLDKNDINSQKKNSMIKNEKFELNNNEKNISNNNVNTSNSLNSKKKIKSDKKLKNQELLFNNEKNNLNNLLSPHESTIFYENDTDIDNNNPLNAPKFPEETVSTNSITLNEHFYKNKESKINNSVNKIFSNDKRIENDSFFLSSNKLVSLSNDMNMDHYTDNTDSSENFIMKNYNTEINLTPYEIHEALIMSEFLEEHKSQLTPVGLKLLQKSINENQLVAFFRNNHFNTLFKYENKLFLLATDISFLYLSCTWELLDNVENDTSYYDHNFESFSSQKYSQKNNNHSSINFKNFEVNNRANMHCVKSKFSNQKKKKRKCTFM